MTGTSGLTQSKGPTWKIPFPWLPTTILNPRDRTTVPIFADGAGALVLRAGTPDEPGAVRAFDLGSDGENSDLIQIPAGGSRQRSAGTPAGPGDGYFTMRGRDVYRHAVERMAASVRRVMDRAGWRLSDVDRLVPHQANSRISTAVAARLDIPDERCLSNIAEVGNTAAVLDGDIDTFIDAEIRWRRHRGD